MLTWTLVFSLWKKFASTWNQSTSKKSTSIFAVFCLIFNHLLKSLFWSVLFSSYDVIFIIFGEKTYGSRLCDMQISYEMVSNAHVLQLTVSLKQEPITRSAQLPQLFLSWPIRRPIYFYLNLPRIQPPQEPKWPITSTDFIISPED